MPSDIARNEAIAMQKTVSGWVNNIGVDFNSFVGAWEQEHPTLQQSFTGMCLMWFKSLAEREYGYGIDARNESSQAAAKKIMTALGDDIFLPYV